MTTSAEKNYCYHCGSCNVKNPNKYIIYVKKLSFMS